MTKQRCGRVRECVCGCVCVCAHASAVHGPCPLKEINKLAITHTHTFLHFFVRVCSTTGGDSSGTPSPPGSQHQPRRVPPLRTERGDAKGAPQAPAQPRQAQPQLFMRPTRPAMVRLCECVCLWLYVDGHARIRIVFVRVFVRVFVCEEVVWT